jgi:hypothetical protein
LAGNVVLWLFTYWLLHLRALLSLGGGNVSEVFKGRGTLFDELENGDESDGCFVQGNEPEGECLS